MPWHSIGRNTTAYRNPNKVCVRCKIFIGYSESPPHTEGRTTVAWCAGVRTSAGYRSLHMEHVLRTLWETTSMSPCKNPISWPLDRYCCCCSQWQQHEAFSGLSNNHLRQAWTLNCQFLDPILHGNDQMMIDDITILKSDI